MLHRDLIDNSYTVLYCHRLKVGMTNLCILYLWKVFNPYAIFVEIIASSPPKLFNQWSIYRNWKRLIEFLFWQIWLFLPRFMKMHIYKFCIFFEKKIKNKIRHYKIYNFLFKLKCWRHQWTPSWRKTQDWRFYYHFQFAWLI